MQIMKKACGLLALAILGFNIAACSTADEGSGRTVVVPLAQDANGNSARLTVNPSAVNTGQTATLTWAVQHAKNCTASSSNPNDTWNGPKEPSPSGGSFVVGPYDTAGNITYVLTCTSSTGGVLSQTATLNVGNNAATTGVHLVSNTGAAKPGETIRLSWTTSGDPDGCTASSTPAVQGWSGSMPTVSPVSGTWLKLEDEGNYVFTLTCSGPNGMATSRYPVTVSAPGASAPPLLQIAARPPSIPQGSSSSIEWMTANATSCVASADETADAWNGSSQPVNDYGSSSTPATFTTASTLQPGTYNYTLACAGPGGNVEQAAQVMVSSGGASPVPSLTFLVSDSKTTTGKNSVTVQVGDVVYLSWVSSNASECMATGGTWAPSDEPTRMNNLQEGPFNSPGNYSFALSCSNASGNSVAQVVQVIVNSNGPSVSFAAQPNPVTQGTAANLVWTASSDASTCQAASGPMEDAGWKGQQPTSGSYAIPSAVYSKPGTYPYVLTCTSPTGTTTATVDFVVNPANGGGPQFTSDFTANPTSFAPAGGSTALTWATTNAVNCTASSNPPLSGWSGSQPTSSPSGGVPLTLPANAGAAPASYMLELSCSDGAGNTMTQSQVVTVQGTMAMPTVTLSASPTMLVAGPGAKTTLTYSTSNVTSCSTSDGTGVWATQPVPNGGATPVTGMADSTALTTAGTYTYTLSCTGPNGQAMAAPVTVTVTSPAPAFLPVRNQAPDGAGLFITDTPGSSTPATQVAPGDDLYFSWDASNATSCTPASNEPAPSAWAGSMTGTSGNDVPAKASVVPGYYSYTITCSGPTDPPVTSTMSVSVVPDNASYCPDTPSSGGAPLNSLALLTDVGQTPSYNATTPSATGGSVCLGCMVGPSPNVLGNVTNAPAAGAPDAFPYGFSDYASMILPVGALANNVEEINVSNGSATAVVYPAGRTVNVGLVAPDALLAASVLGNASISTTLNGVVQDSTTSAPLVLQLLGVIGGGSSGYATLTASKPFDGVRVNFGGTVTATSELRVHMACVSLK